MASSSSHKYMFVMYVYNSNKILADTIKNITGPYIASSYENYTKKIVYREFRPTMHWLENEASRVLKYFDNT